MPPKRWRANTLQASAKATARPPGSLAVRCFSRRRLAVLLWRLRDRAYQARLRAEWADAIAELNRAQGSTEDTDTEPLDGSPATRYIWDGNDCELTDWDDLPGASSNEED